MPAPTKRIASGIHRSGEAKRRSPLPSAEHAVKQPVQIHHLWAKYDTQSRAYHPLIYRLLDVAAVAACMWDLALSRSQKTHLQKLLELDDKPTRQLLALLAGLHDIGKATPAFQQLDDTRHGALSAAIVNVWLDSKGVNPIYASRLAAAMYRYIGPFLNTGKEADLFMIASLFALHPASKTTGNMGDHMRALAGKRSKKATENHFLHLLDKRRDTLESPLRRAITMLKDQDIPINWHQLMRDIRNWDHPDHFVQRNWARAFWRPTPSNA